MKKFETLEDLAKATGQLAGYFTKNADFHKAAHAAHAGLHAHHEAQAAFHKAAHDAMDDGHEMKAHVGKVAEHHTAKAAHHKSMAELHKTYMEDSTKLAAAFGEDAPIQKVNVAPVIGTGDNSMVEILKAAFNENVAAIKDSPEFREMVKGLAMEQVRQLFGNTVQPSDAVKVFGERASGTAADNLRLIHRAGGGPTEAEKGQVPAQLEDALAI